MSHRITPIIWQLPKEKVFALLKTTASGLTNREAKQRLVHVEAERLRPPRRSGAIDLFLNQFKSPITLLLIFAGILAFLISDISDTVIILSIVFISNILSFWQEYRASHTVEKLLNLVTVNTRIRRDDKELAIPSEEVVPGDIVLLSAGASIPGDCYLLECKDLFVNEAVLTGETFPVEKRPLTASRSLNRHTTNHILYLGTYVMSGKAEAVVVEIGKATRFGLLTEKLKGNKSDTEFESGVKHFGYLLMEITFILVLLILAINIYLGRSPLDSLLFALALAVGLTPQLLPAIISINLSHGARRMAEKKVVVKRLASIENFGSMTVLCSDKTGTLTEGGIRLHTIEDWRGQHDDRITRYATLCAHYESGFTNPINEALRHHSFPSSEYLRLDEVPFDPFRKRLSLLVRRRGESLLLTKGSLEHVLAVSSQVASGYKIQALTSKIREHIMDRFTELSRQGCRVQGIATRPMQHHDTITKNDEKELTFLGLLAFADSPKVGINHTIASLKRYGVTLKIVTGDNAAVALGIGQKVGFKDPTILTGSQMSVLSDDLLKQKVGGTDIFAEVEPDQKERIIRALQQANEVVGYMGDGINDSLALKAADVGISVNHAVDVAKEAADIVLLEKDLDVLLEGIREGRRTFANTLKYVFMATSANLGNMISMAGASVILPFFPLLPKQILLMNLLTDLPEATIATDHVEGDFIRRPHRWNLASIKKFMITFGLLSSIFDFLTFIILLNVLHATPDQFQTGWFMESVLSAICIVLIVRTRRSFLESRPSSSLLLATVLVGVLVIWLPFSPLNTLFSFAPLPINFFISMAVIVIFYSLSASVLKHIFYKLVKF